MSDKTTKDETKPPEYVTRDEFFEMGGHMMKMLSRIESCEKRILDVPTLLRRIADAMEGKR